MKIKTLDHLFQRVLIGLFSIMIFAPGLWMLIGPHTEISYTEKRTLAEFPPVPSSIDQVQNFFSGVDNYLNDHFGFREWMVYRYQREIRKRFNVDDSASKIINGLDNWYFYSGDDMLEDFAGRRLRNEKDLREWLNTYRDKQKWLESQGIKYLLAVPPNKMTVYGEYIGEPWASQKGKTRFTQLKNSMTESDTATFLDLSKTLIREKNSENLYL